MIKSCVIIPCLVGVMLLLSSNTRLVLACSRWRECSVWGRERKEKKNVKLKKILPAPHRRGGLLHREAVRTKIKVKHADPIHHEDFVPEHTREKSNEQKTHVDERFAKRLQGSHPPTPPKQAHQIPATSTHQNRRRAPCKEEEYQMSIVMFVINFLRGSVPA